MDPEFSNNVILTQTEFLTMNSRPKQPKYARNKNILVIGGSGSGKTRFFVKPNLMQMHSSYVVTDPKGTVLVECGKMLEKGGYVILAYSIALSNSRVFPACSSHAEACTFRFSKTVCSAAALSSRSFTSSARGKAVSGEISAPFVSK